MDKNILVYIFIGVVLLIPAVGIWLIDRDKVKKRIARLQDRKDMNEEDIFEAYYKDVNISKETVSLVIKKVAQIFKIPICKIRPTDNFEEVYKTTRKWEFGDVYIEVIWFVEHEMKKAGIRKFDETVQLETVDDVIRVIDKIKKQK